MDWENEEYVRVYRRETDDDLVLSWQARALWKEMLIKFDRSGLLETRRAALGVSVIVRMPLEVVEAALPELLADGRLEIVPSGYFAPNFMDAQEARKSDRQRQHESRRRRALDARSRKPDNEMSQPVTSGHDRSQHVTLTSADPLLRSADPESPTRARAIPYTVLPGTSELRRRQEARSNLLAELNEARQAAAAELGVEHRPLAAQDPGERSLSDRLVAANGDLERVVSDARHVIRTATAEAIATRSLQWLTGVIFEDRNFRRYSAMTVEEAKRPRDGPRGRGPDRNPERPNPMKPM